MKTPYREALIILLCHVVFLLSSCSFNYTKSENNKNIPIEKSSITVSKNALRFIQENSTDSLVSILAYDIAKATSSKRLDELMTATKIILDNSYYPDDSTLIVSQSTNYSLLGSHTFDTYVFPFYHKEKKDSVNYIHITVADNQKIQKLFISNSASTWRIVEPSRTEPHLNTINMQSNNIKWFRVWYSSGYKNTNLFNNRSYYAVSGNNSTLSELGLHQKFQEIFDLIHVAKIDSTDYKYLKEEKIGNPEWIYLRLKFNNEQYKNLGEFEISYFISEESGKKETMSDYIIVKHTEKTRYLLLKDKNPTLTDKLKEIAYFNYGKYYEKNP